MLRSFAASGRAIGFLAVALVGLASGSAVAGEAIGVQTVPWVPTAPHIPHSAISGQPTILQAVGRSTDCGLPITYRWDVDGDGVDDTEPVEVVSLHDLSHVHTYEVAEETVFVARVTASCGPQSASATFPVRVHVEPTLRNRVDRSISHGMWWGHVTLQRDEAAGTALLPTLAQAGIGFGISDPQADTAALLQVFLNRGHRAGIDPADDPYRADVELMMRYLLGLYAEFPLVDALRGGEDPDRNGNQLGLRPVTTQNGGGYESYVGGGMMEAIASFGDPDRVLAADLPAGVGGRRLADVMQDMADFYLWQQSAEPMGDGIRGGWNYDVPSRVADISLTGWTTVALAAARDHMGADVPAWALDRLLLGVMAADNGLQAGAGPSGTFAYSSASGGNSTPARSGAAMTAFGLVYRRDPSPAHVQATVSAIANWFVNPPRDAYSANIGNMYAMYQIAKGLRSFEPPFEIIGDGIDWYRLYAEHILSVQNDNGRIIGAPGQNWIGPRAIGHGLALLVLIPSVFDALPVATARATPRRVLGGETVTFAHGESYALDPAAPLVWYRWDVVQYAAGLDRNGDGDFDDADDIAPEDIDGDGLVSGDEVVWELETRESDAVLEWVHGMAFVDAMPRVVQARLQVEDRLGRIAEDTVDIEVTPRPAPVLAVEPVVVVEGETVRVVSGVVAPEGEAVVTRWQCPAELAVVENADGSLVIDATALDGPADPLVFECTVTVQQANGAPASMAFSVTVPNRVPEIVALDLEGLVVIGEPVGLVVVGDDAEADLAGLVYGVDCEGDGIFEITGVAADALVCTFGEGVRQLVVSVEDDDGGRSERALDVAQFVDSDGDGMPDAWEEENGTDPTVPDGDADPDGDGVPNRDEYENGTDPLVPDGVPDAMVDATVPDATVPDATVPDATVPDAMAPDAMGPDQPPLDGMVVRDDVTVGGDGGAGSGDVIQGTGCACDADGDGTGGGWVWAALALVTMCRRRTKRVE